MIRQKEKLTSRQKIKGHRTLTYDILDGMVDWVRVINNNGIIIYANKSMEEALGKNIVGAKCYSVFGKSCPCVRCITDTTVSTGEIAEKEEEIGDKIYSIKSSPVRDIDDNIYAVVEVFRDVTRERKLEKEIIKKNEKMSKDLAFARKIQKTILPKKGSYGSIDVDYLYSPSEMLSGDMFDICRIDQDHIGIYISDVVGHGVTASIMTMFVKQSMAGITSEYLSPSKAISQLHKNFLDLNLDDENYFTIFYGVINTKNNTFTYVNGGHNSIPLLIKDDKVSFLEATGYPITSLFNEVKYEEQAIKLDKDDKILLYTDGIIEAKNEDKELFGIDRLVQTVKNSDKDLINSIKEKIDEFKYDELEDDFTILQLKVI
ncbi:putative phosphatase [Gottschalkia purinilytica]|uniref:Putative phosphatase n=1 Tax=Gottschalkia purinilytica TaxID=1503 RepID=A0A0L0W8K6_GOTPU|nr:SpoIIE family protein phosphatase [Gottschalkia purinilytica]KNF07781.1 putative phosphatase [Gottschalkia purinilytica]